MANLDKCMLFYLKYAAEMERLYEVEEPKVEGLPNPDQVRKQIKLVGDTANRKVAEFLEICALGIEEHFRAFSTVRRINNRDAWVLSFKIAPKKAPERQFWIGVNIDRDQAYLMPWVWCRGGRRAEDELLRILGRGIKAARLPGWNSGTVVLDEIKIPIPERLGEPVECDSLVVRIQQVFASFTEQDIAAIDGITSNRGEA